MKNIFILQVTIYNKTLYTMKRTIRESIRQINNMIGRIDHTTIIKEQETAIASGPTTPSQKTAIASGPTAPSVEFPPEIADQSDDIKRMWYCLDDRENRGWNISEDNFQRFQVLHSAIDGVGTDEDLVWKVMSGFSPEETKAGYVPKGKATRADLAQMYPMLACVHGDKPWEQNYMKENDLEGKRVFHWIMDDFSGAEGCYLQKYILSDGKSGTLAKECGDKHGYFWWNKTANWIKELF